MGWLPGRSGWSADDVPDQTGRVALITGANSGIGLEAAIVLARRGADVIMGCRDPGRGSAAADRVRADAKGAVHLIAMDLADLGSVRAAAAEVQSRFPALHLLINNAGVMAIPKQATKDGFEMQLGTNHLGHFALTGLLLDLLRRSGESARPSRIVSISSQAHRFFRIDFDDLMCEKRYDRWIAYCRSKLANLLFMTELQRRLERAAWPVIAVAAHPGYSSTNLQKVGPQMRGASVEERIMDLGGRIIAQSSADGALPTLRAATDPDARGGDYFGPNAWFEFIGAPVKVGMTAAARDEASAARLWEMSESLTGVTYPGL